jgi:hypothetical protein
MPPLGPKVALKLCLISARDRLCVLGLIDKDSPPASCGEIELCLPSGPFLPNASPPSTRNDLNCPVNRIGLDRYP